MSMCKVLCVTNRHLAAGDFLKQIEKAAAARVDGIILREKDMEEKEYQRLAEQVQSICVRSETVLILHTCVRAARTLGVRRIHLPYEAFCKMEKADRDWFHMVGVSVHSVEAAAEAQKRGAAYLTAGHIFATDCKKGVPPRGTSFLKAVCQTVEIPVYAIGGITPENAGACVQAGAEGVCLMSSLMQAEEPEALLRRCFSQLPQVSVPSRPRLCLGKGSSGTQARKYRA